MVLHFPLTDENDDAARTFEDACRQAAELCVTLVLTRDVILSETITLRNQQCLTIEGKSKRVRISGELHSLFLLNNKSQLILRNVDLEHNLYTDDHKQVGAAINVRYKGKVDVSNSQIVSTSGFCVWAVQKSHVHLQQCDLEAKARSAMVCFGQVECQLDDCQIPEAGVHGLCARGACQIYLRRCTISASAGRAIYAYANASVHLEHCHVHGTLHPEKAAIEVSSMGCSETTSSALILRDCHVTNNRGAGVRLRGNVSSRSEGQNVLENNDKGDWDILDECDVVQPEATGISDSSSPAFQRDETGSSFRQGDWWCLSCQVINAARRNHQDVCNQCSVERFKCGRLLTMDEIRQCNKGIDIRKSLLLLQDEPRTKFDEEVDSIVRPQVVWEFDSDDARGWLPYDDPSSLLLEEKYLHTIHTTSSPVSSSGEEAFCISLSDDKYLVNVLTMEQTNIETQFLRKVRRRIIG